MLAVIISFSDGEDRALYVPSRRAGKLIIRQLEELKAFVRKCSDFSLSEEELARIEPKWLGSERWKPVVELFVLSLLDDIEISFRLKKLRHQLVGNKILLN